MVRIGTHKVSDAGAFWVPGLGVSLYLTVTWPGCGVSHSWHHVDAHRVSDAGTFWVWGIGVGCSACNSKGRMFLEQQLSQRPQEHSGNPWESLPRWTFQIQDFRCL